MFQRIKKQIKCKMIDLCLALLGAKRVTIGDLWNQNASTPVEQYVDGKLKFIAESNNNSLVLTPSGFKPLYKIYKTIPYPIFILKTVNGNTLRCANNHLIFNVDKQCFVYVKDCYRGENIKTLYGIEQIESINGIRGVDYMYDAEIDDLFEHSYFTNNILSHNTTTIGAYLLWYVAFRDDDDPVTVLVVSNKGDNAKEIIERIKTMYESMPMWLKPGVTEDGYNKHSIKFDNGSCIVSQATTENSGRGLSISLLFCHHKTNTVDILDENDNISTVSMEELENLLNT